MKNIIKAIPVYLLVMCVSTHVATAGGRIYSFGYSTSLPDENINIKAVSAGYMHSLALNDSGKVIAWGDNSHGQITVPTNCLSDISGISASGFHSLAVNSVGKVIAWGDDSFGQTTVPKAALSNVRDVSAGLMHSLALLRTGRVLAWGDSMFNQAYVPSGLSRVIKISAGALHSMALRNDGMVFIWGDNSFGQGTVPDRALSGITEIAAGYFHNLALTTNGEVIAWGDNSFGQCNVPAAARQGVVSISAGQDHSLALKADGTLVTWGGRSGQTPFSSSVPNLTAISAGGYHSLGLVPEDADTNQNKIPDWWELQNNLDPAASANMGSDCDRDGMTDYEEYLTDTDPWDNRSYFRANIIIDPATGDVSIQIAQASTARSYSLEYASEVTKGSWRAISGSSNIRVFSDNVPAIMSIDDSKESRIYRIRASAD